MNSSRPVQKRSLTPRRPALRRMTVKALRKLRINKVAHRLYYRHFHGFRTANKYVLPAIECCFAEAGRLGTLPESDYMEFGIFKAYSFWHAQEVASRTGAQHMRFFGFDSFRGLPEVHGVDATPDEDFYLGQYAASKDEVLRNLNARGVDWARTFLVEGYFRDSLSDELKRRHDMRRVSIALIDCDLYESAARVLDFLSDLIGDGTILMFDDWNAFNSDSNRGERRAFREFLDCRSDLRARHLLSYGHYGSVFVLNETAR
jgi:O-methyltransferase